MSCTYTPYAKTKSNGDMCVPESCLEINPPLNQSTCLSFKDSAETPCCNWDPTPNLSRGCVTGGSCNNNFCNDYGTKSTCSQLSQTDCPCGDGITDCPDNTDCGTPCCKWQNGGNSGGGGNSGSGGNSGGGGNSDGLCDSLLNGSCKELLSVPPNGNSCKDVKAQKAILTTAARVGGCNQSDAEKYYNKTLSCACDLSTGAIVGIVVGSVAFDAIIIFIILRMRKYKMKTLKKLYIFSQILNFKSEN